MNNVKGKFCLGISVEGYPLGMMEVVGLISGIIIPVHIKVVPVNFSAAIVSERASLTFSPIPVWQRNQLHAQRMSLLCQTSVTSFSWSIIY